MKSIYKIIITTLFTIVFTIFGCSDFLDETPDNLISSANFYKSEADAIAAVNGVYDVLGRTNMYGHLGMLIFGDVTTDIAFGGENFIRDFAEYNVAPSNPVIAGFYEDSYVLINRANAVINNVSGADIDVSVQEEVIGEAKFLRALAYFNLVRVFGGVPLLTSETSSLSNLKVPRNTEAEVYAQIVEDLLDAETKIPANTSNGGRATAYAATSLLAKVYLTLGEYENARSKANSVIGNFSLYSNYEDVFSIANKNSGTEVIFEVQFSDPQELNQFPQFFITRDLTPVFGGSVFGVYTATDELVNSFTVNDSRRDYTVWLDGTQVGAPEIIFADPGINKLLDGARQGLGIPTAGQTNYPVLRYSDVLLTLAEAENELNGPNSTAYNAINQVRNRAGIGDLTAGLSQSAFLDALLEERKLELAIEGHRWFDLKRAGQLETELSEFGFQSNNVVFPIPQSAIDANDALEQNPGY